MARREVKRPEAPVTRHPLIRSLLDVSEEPPTPDDNPGPGKKPKSDERKCEQLRRAFIEAKADERAARYLRDANQKAYEEKYRELKRLETAYEAKLRAFAVENALTIWDMQKGKIPRGIVFPSDLLAAKRAYETAFRESEILLDELRRARDLHKLAESRVAEIREKMKAVGCAKSD